MADNYDAQVMNPGQAAGTGSGGKYITKRSVEVSAGVFADAVVPIIGTTPASASNPIPVATAPGGASSAGYAARVQIIRPSDTTTYGAGDVVGVTGGGTACITFPNMGPIGGGEIIITSARFQRNATALISGEGAYILYLFNVAQPSAQVDNAAFDIAAGDQAAYLGKIILGTPVDEVSTLAVDTDAINKQITLLSSSLFGVLVTVAGYQPASAAVHVVNLHSLAV